MGDGKWAIRGGYGIFFEHTNGNESNTDLLEPDNINSQTTQCGEHFRLCEPQFRPAWRIGRLHLTATSIPSKATWPYVQQWHLDIQHDLGRGTVATLSYVGSAGVHLTRAYELNQILAGFQQSESLRAWTDHHAIRLYRGRTVPLPEWRVATATAGPVTLVIRAA